MLTKETADYNRLPQIDVVVNGIRLHYVDAGEGPVVVLVHGSPLSSFSFSHQIEALSAHFRVIAPDLPGFGRSQAVETGPIFQQHARTLRALFDHLDLDKIRLVGHDWGGPIGVGSMIDQLDRVIQLVLINTTLRSSFAPPIYWRQFIASGIGEFLLVKLNVFGWGLPFMMRAARSAPIQRQYMQHLKTPSSRRTVLALERLEGFEILVKEIELVLPAARMPMLVIWGHPDQYFGRHELEQLRETFPHAAIAEIPGGGHFPMDDAPQIVTEELLRFLLK